MELIDMRKKITDMPWAFPQIWQTTYGHFKIEMEIAKITIGDIAIS